jgi:hypothetical protein
VLRGGDARWNLPRAPAERLAQSRPEKVEIPAKPAALPERLSRRMYGLLTIETSGCIAFSLPVHESTWIDQAPVIDAKPLT